MMNVPEVLEQMIPYFTDTFGNPSSLHNYGRKALKAVDESREIIAKCIGAKANEIYFTSGGSESDNWALKGVVKASKQKKKHIRLLICFFKLFLTAILNSVLLSNFSKFIF